MRGPVESGQYTSGDYTQELTDHVVLGSIGTVGDALDNALAESFVDSYKTELIADRIWRSRSQLELATVEWVAWFNHERLHESLGDIPPVEFEALHAPIPVNGSVAALSPKAADRLTTCRIVTIGFDLASDGSISVENAPDGRRPDPARTATNGSPGTNGRSLVSPLYGQGQCSLTGTSKQQRQHQGTH